MHHSHSGAALLVAKRQSCEIPAAFVLQGPGKIVISERRDGLSALRGCSVAAGMLSAVHLLHGVISCWPVIPPGFVPLAGACMMPEED